MATSALQALPGGPGWRPQPAGLRAGAPLSRIQGPRDALGLVADELSATEVALRELLVSDVAAVPEVAGHLVDAGGKRLRPALSALGARAISHPVSPALLCVGELIHLGSLLHDDVVDDGLTRRGRLAAHRLWGSAVSVLSGDFCLARAVLLAAEEGGHVAVTELARAVTAMAEGEVLQLQRAGDLSTSRATYIEVVERKSAALIAWCAAAGAYAAGDAVAAAALEDYGRKVGVAFQITDDVLDYRPGTGKTPGVDVQQRKVTLPLLYALDADPGLRDLLEAGEPTDAELPGLLHRVVETGALSASMRDAHALVDEGIAALDALPPGDGRDALVVLGRYLVERAA